MYGPRLTLGKAAQTPAPAAAASTPAQPLIYGAITLNSKYSELPANAKAEIDNTYNLFKKPMAEGLTEIATARPNLLTEVGIKLEQTRLASLKMETRLEQLRCDAEIFRDDVKQQHRDAQRFGRNGIQQISRNVTTVGNYMNEDLPIEFYLVALSRLERRLSVCTDEVRRFSQQLDLVLDDFSSTNATNRYGQRAKVGTHDVVQLLQSQNHAFIRMAALVADVHDQSEKMRTQYLEHYCRGGSNPFLAADRDEAAKQRRMMSKIHLEVEQSGHPTAAPAPAPVAGGFGGFGAPAPAPAAGGFGGFGAPAPAPAAGGFAGFGAPAPAPAAGGFAGFGAPAPAPATGGFGGFGAPAPAPAAGGFAGFGAPAPAAGGFGGLDGSSPRPTVKPKKKK